MWVWGVGGEGGGAGGQCVGGVCVCMCMRVSRAFERGFSRYIGPRPGEPKRAHESLKGPVGLVVGNILSLKDILTKVLTP